MPGSLAAVPAFGPATPEILLAASALVFILWGAFKGEQAARGITIATLLVILFAAVLVMAQSGERVTTFNGSFINDAFSRFMKVATLIGSGRRAVGRWLGYALGGAATKI